MASEPELRDLFTRVAVLERQAAVSDERHTQNLARFDKIDGGISGMDSKLDQLITRNNFQDGGSSVRAGIIKALIAFATAGFSGGMLVELWNWFTGRAHP